MRPTNDGDSNFKLIFLSVLNVNWACVISASYENQVLSLETCDKGVAFEPLNFIPAFIQYGLNRIPHGDNAQ